MLFMLHVYPNKKIHLIVVVKGTHGCWEPFKLARVTWESNSAFTDVKKGLDCISLLHQHAVF